MVNGITTIPELIEKLQEAERRGYGVAIVLPLGPELERMSRLASRWNIGSAKQSANLLEIEIGSPRW